MSPSIAIGISHPFADKQWVSSGLGEYLTQTAINAVVAMKQHTFPYSFENLDHHSCDEGTECMRIYLGLVIVMTLSSAKKTQIHM